MLNSPYNPPAIEVPECSIEITGSMREMSRHTLTCPTCGKKGIFVQQATLCYPRFKVRCRSCHDHLRVTLIKSSRRIFNLVWLPPIAVGLLEIALLKWTDPFAFLHRSARRWTPNLWWLVADSFGNRGQLILIGIILLTALLLPILFLCKIAYKTNLRLIMTTANLTSNQSDRSLRSEIG